MAVLTLIDWAKRLDPTGKVAVITEMLSNTNEILSDMQWGEGNLPTGHRTVVRTGLPTVAWRILNGGVTPSKSSTQQIDESCGMLEAYSEVDKDLAELNGNLNDFRLSEARPFLESMSQEMAATLFYGNTSTAPEEFLGLAPRYSSLSAVNAQNIIDAAGAGSDNTSIWLVVWSDQTVHGIFPKGSKAGLVHEDLGLETVTVTAGIGNGLMRAYRDHFQWKCGLALRDWRYAVRICNIDISDLVANTAPADLTNAMIKAIHRVPNIRSGKAAFYVNRTVMQMLDIQRRDDIVTGGGLTYQTVDGVLTPNFRGIPIRICDALVQNEARVT